MKKKINIQLIGIAVLAAVTTLILVGAIFYDLFQKQVLSDLEAYAHMLQVDESVDADSLDVYKSSMDNLRLTLINPEGDVLYDSDVALTSTMENHSSRPEIKKALADGEGTAIRKSATLNQNTYYYAVLLKNGNILRIAKNASSISNIFLSALPVIFLVAAGLIAICTVLAHFLTKSLVRPIEEMATDMDHMEDVKSYEELIPFIQTINSQHQDILKSAKMRQEFTANVSHELKTPLASISGYSELIENGMAGEEDVARFAGEIHRNSTRLLTLINDIIRLSELDSEEVEAPMELVDLYGLASTCVSMLRMNAENRNVTLTLEGHLGVVLGNRQMLEEVLYNLCDNGIRYNVQGGSVVVTVCKQEDDEVLLSVKDTGIGIPKEHQQRVFERFYRVDKSRSKQTGGTGLGLAIVKHIVAKHHAVMSIESEPGKGTEIRIVFPI